MSSTYKYQQDSPDRSLSLVLPLEFPSDGLSALKGHTVGATHHCRGVAKPVNSAAHAPSTVPTMLLCVTSEEKVAATCRLAPT